MQLTSRPDPKSSTGSSRHDPATQLFIRVSPRLQFPRQLVGKSYLIVSNPSLTQKVFSDLNFLHGESLSKLPMLPQTQSRAPAS